MTGQWQGGLSEERNAALRAIAAALLEVAAAIDRAHDERLRREPRDDDAT